MGKVRWLRNAGRLAVLLVAVGVGFLVPTLQVDPLEPRADAVVEGVDMDRVRIDVFEELGGGIEIAPSEVPIDTLLVFYPGGLVRPHAYVWMGVALAPRGVRTVIPAMPFDLAVLGRDRADGLMDAYGASVDHVVLAGHSLGGAMAASYAARNPGNLDGLVLMGAYPAGGDDLSGLELPTLVLAAEHDGLASLSEVEEGLTRLPAGTPLEVLPGAVHAFFGRYGPQRGDGAPSRSRHDVEQDVIERVARFVSSLD